MAKEQKTKKEIEKEIAKKIYEIEVLKIDLKYLEENKPNKIWFITN